MIEPELRIPQDKLEAICARYAVHEFAIFGSAVTAGFRPESDVDILVEFKPEAHVGFLMLSRLQRELSSLLNRHVDLVPKKGLKEPLRKKCSRARRFCMRREALYLRDIVEAAHAIAEFIQGANAEDFKDNDLLRSAVLHKLTIILKRAVGVPGKPVRADV